MDEETLRNLEMRVVELENQVKQFRATLEATRTAQFQALQSGVPYAQCGQFAPGSCLGGFGGICLCRKCLCLACTMCICDFYNFCAVCSSTGGLGGGGNRFGGLGG